MDRRPRLRQSHSQFTPETPAIFFTENDDQTGPFTVAEIRTKLAAGEISPEAWYWREGMEEWRAVWELSHGVKAEQ